jgi:hypothetical protein
MERNYLCQQGSCCHGVPGDWKPSLIVDTRKDAASAVGAEQLAAAVVALGRDRNRGVIS